MTTFARLPFAFVLIASTLTIASAQTDSAAVAPPATTPSSLNQRFVQLKAKANNYQDYEVIKKGDLAIFWKNVQDSIYASTQQIKVAQREIQAQKTELGNLKQAVAQKDRQVQSSSYDIAHINVLGINMLKENYLYFSWGIIFALIAALTVAVFKYKGSNKMAVDRLSEYENVRQELDGYKVRLRERETTMGRDLQTERNRIEELSQRIAFLEKKVHS